MRQFSIVGGKIREVRERVDCLEKSNQLLLDEVVKMRSDMSQLLDCLNGNIEDQSDLLRQVISRLKG